jgi:predicted nucleic acid-binding protein
VILPDTSGVLAWIDGSQRLHEETAEAMSGQEGPFLLSPFVLAELDYLLATRVGMEQQHRLLLEVTRGAFELAVFPATDLERALELMRTFSDLAVGLADASICVLAERVNCRTVLTLDERHFRVLPGPRGAPFRLLPADR